MSPTRYHYATLLTLPISSLSLFQPQQQLFALFMHLQSSHEHQPTPSRKIGVILLTDNREPANHERSAPDYRCSAFKETEIDPFEDRQREGASVWGEPLEELGKRVVELERKVSELERLEERTGRAQSRSTKLRRRSSEIDRHFQCTLCRKSYGSETALKCHRKLKHSSKAQQKH